jgi:hypothetical protein
MREKFLLQSSARKQKRSMKKRWFATAQDSANMSVTVPADIGKPSGLLAVFKKKINLEEAVASFQ